MGRFPKLLGSAGAYLVASLINAGIPFLLIPVLTRVLTPADYSLISIFTVVMIVSGALTGLSLHGSVAARTFSTSRDELSAFLSSGIALVLVNTAVVVVVVVVGRAPLERIIGLPLPWLITAVLASSLLAVSSVRLALWQVKGEAFRFSVFQIGQGLLNAGLTLLLVLHFSMRWEGRVAAQVSAISVFSVFACTLIWKDGYVVGIGAFRRHWASALRFGLPLVPHVVGAMIIAGGGQLLVANMIGAREAGLYVIAMQFGAAFGICVEACGRVYQPWLFSKLREASEESHLLVVGVSCWAFGCLFALAGVASVITYAAFPYIVGVEFLEARSILLAFFAGAAFQGMYLTVSGLYFYFEKTKYLAAVTIVSGGCGLLMMWALGDRYGVLGVSIAYSASQLLVFLLATIVARTIHPLPWNRFTQGMRLVYLLQRKSTT